MGGFWMIKAASLPASGALSRASRIAARSLLQTKTVGLFVGARLARDGVGTDIKKPPGLFAEPRWP
ncbi:hypothetical protein C4K05_4099 [Pseudomonas chlororaphis subsp. aureofaciens]|uniref:Uncharacterized protein n=1 Tax=Pseudomonas chlororaphis subsp. aureofaciens TaxID=587851 RepID=A0AAD0ZJT6_9PSED|nr:hypothetical protein C4K10_4041 [Pseudomonas chlororaphis subsp. aureofaciens]AZE30803.1 hypothetical protein C4K07_4022 [Pseudomonas chlororaphis subsp. aureofaciens]AZE37119.1 hypothetical protein C4K06_4090 [Pseudomonas chlororaphis subsp. aureofaciens]AZE43435.1 hypothetical protein C4K05_4099 [Pseudomonas chlororaphis subsp. aureofaciens]